MRTRLFAATVVAALTAVSLAACGGSAEPTSEPAASSSAPAAQFPVTIKHAFGETTIESQPERIATVAWANHEVPIALGVVPVGMSKATWGDDDGDGVLPWVEEKLTELGAQTPVLFDETDGIDFEAVSDTTPDVILASYSGLTQEEYDTLSKIAPVVAYPDLAWSTSMQDMIKMNSRAIGKATEGDQLIASPGPAGRRCGGGAPADQGQERGVLLHRHQGPQPGRFLHHPRPPAGLLRTARA